MKLTTFILAVGCALAQEPAELQQQLSKVRRIHVDRLTGGEAADQIRDMLMSSLQSARLWVITENPDKADAFLRGAADDVMFNETHESHDGVGARASLATRDGDYSVRPGRGSRTDRAGSVGISQNEGQRNQERKHEATAALRLVNKDGDLIWSATKESSGAKFKGAAADVADKIVKQLVADFESLRKGPVAPR